MTLGEEIKRVRELKNFSQEELAEQSEVSRQAVSKWETGNIQQRIIESKQKLK